MSYLVGVALLTVACVLLQLGMRELARPGARSPLRRFLAGEAFALLLTAMIAAGAATLASGPLVAGTGRSLLEAAASILAVAAAAALTRHLLRRPAPQSAPSHPAQPGPA